MSHDFQNGDSFGHYRNPTLFPSALGKWVNKQLWGTKDNSGQIPPFPLAVSPPLVGCVNWDSKRAVDFPKVTSQLCKQMCRFLEVGVNTLACYHWNSGWICGRVVAAYTKWLLKINRQPMRKHLSHDMRKSVYAICKQQRRRSACASAQSDQCLCCSLHG